MDFLRQLADRFTCNPHAFLLVAFILFLAAAALALLRAHASNPSIDLWDLVTGDNGRISSMKFFAAGAFFVTLYAFMDLVATGHNDIAAIAAFAGLWASAALTNKAINQGIPGPPTITTTTTVRGDKDGA